MQGAAVPVPGLPKNPAPHTGTAAFPVPAGAYAKSVQYFGGRGNHLLAVACDTAADDLMGHAAVARLVSAMEPALNDGFTAAFDVAGMNFSAAPSPAPRL